MEFADLVNFIEEETILITDPMFSMYALDSFMDKVQRSHHRNRGVKKYATKTDITEKEENVRFDVICVRKIMMWVIARNFWSSV